MQSPDTSDTKASFRKPSNEAACRQYRRRSPANGSSSSDGSPKHDQNSSPTFSREDPAQVSDPQQGRKDDERELDRDPGRRRHGRGGDSYRHPDRQSSRSSHGYSRNDDYVRHDKYANDEDRNYQRLSSRSVREFRANAHSDYTRQEIDHSRSKDYLSSGDKSSHDRYDVTGPRSKDKEKESAYLDRHKYKDKDSLSDRGGSSRRHTSSNSEDTDRDWHKRDRDGRDEKRDYHRSSGDYRNDRAAMYEESRGRQNDSPSGRERGGYRLKEVYKGDPKEPNGQKLAKEEKKKYNDSESNRDKDRCNRADKPDFASEKQETATKRQKFSNWDKGADYVKDAAEKMFSSSMQGQDTGGNECFVQAQANDSVANDLDAAKVAAMKAAELVNRNLVGVGYMSADQKKKLLWGNKKSTTSEETGNRWNSALLGDRDRQEKFNKLMSLRLPWYIWPIVGCEGRWEGREPTKQSRGQQSPPSREAEGTSTGFREAVHCWTSKERWTHSWIRSISINIGSFMTLHNVCVFCFTHVQESSFFCCYTYGVLWNLLVSLGHFKMLGEVECHFHMVVVQSSSGFACMFAVDILISLLDSKKDNHDGTSIR